MRPGGRAADCRERRPGRDPGSLFRLAETSEGAFDPTIKPLVRLWRRAFRQKKLPDPAELAEARELVGFQNLKVDLACA